LHQCLGDETHLWGRIEFAGDDLVGPSGEPADALAEQNAEGAQETTDLVLDLDPDPHQHLAGDQKGANLVAVAAFDAHLLKPAGSHDLRQASSVVAVRLHRSHLQSCVGMTGIDAQNWNTARGEFVPKPY